MPESPKIETKMEGGDSGGSLAPEQMGDDGGECSKLRPDSTKIKHVQKYINRFVEIGSKSELIILTLTYDEVTTFFEDLEDIITELQNVGETYMPIGIVSNSLHPDQEVLILLRTVSKVHNFPESGWRDSDPKSLANRYSFLTINPSLDFKTDLSKMVSQLHSEKGQMVVGGF
jgi:hypothetical protein